MLAVVLLAGTLLASTGVRTGSSLALQATLDESWRGLYDLVVTAPGTATEVGGLLSPTSLTSLSERMTLEDVEAVRGVPGVEVAAPVGEAVLDVVGTTRLYFTAPLDRATTSPDPVAYRVTLTYTTHDGISERVVSDDTVALVIDASGAPNEVVLPPENFDAAATCLLDGEEVLVTEAEQCRTVHRPKAQVQSVDGWYGTDEEVGDHLVFTFDAEPKLVPRALLVDPRAERQLLGEQGSFLDALIDAAAGVGTVDDLTQWARGAEPTDHVRAVAQVAAALDRDRAQTQADGGALTPVPVIPFLVADRSAAPLELEMSVESGFGEVTPDEFTGWAFPDDVLTATGTPLGAATVDVASLLRPLVGDRIHVPLPGTPPPPGPLEPRPLLTPIIGAVTTGDLPTELLAGQADAGAETVRLAAAGYHDATYPVGRSEQGFVNPQPEGTPVGREAMYLAAGKYETVETTDATAYPYAVVVGDFDPTAVAPDDSGLGYVPVGGLDPVGSVLVAGPGGDPIERVELAPALSGFGLANAAPAAITDIARASQWGTRRPVSAVRVRVADVGGYTAENVARVEAVAHRITELGYTVTLAAGSSRQDIMLAVEGYAFGTSDPNGTQEVGALGMVEQRWPRLGVAVTVESAVTAATTAVLWLAVTVAVLLLTATQMVAVPARRRATATLSGLGWRRHDVVRWFLAEEALVVLGVVLAAALAVVVGSMQDLGAAQRGTQMAAVVAVVGALVSSAVGVVGGSRPASAMRRRRHPRKAPRRVLRLRWGLLRSARGFGVRQVRAHLWHTVPIGLAAIAVALAAASLVAVMRAGVTSAGATDLGVFAAAQGVVFQILLAVVALAGGLALVRTAQRTDERTRATQWAALRAGGWTAGDVRRSRITEMLIVVLPATAIASATALAGATYGGLGGAPVLGATAATAGLAVAGALTLGIRRRMT